MAKKNFIFTTLCIAIISSVLSGCKLAILDPAGMIAKAQSKLFIEATFLMLIVVVPVIFLAIVISIRYRAKNKNAEYKPGWHHSDAIEIVCWTIPCLIIIALGAITWISSHELDPYRPIKIKGKQPIEIQAVALDWKWLFIYPKQHVATINYLQIPVNTPITFHITADAPMNSLEIPRLAGQIYAMGGMQTLLHIVADKPGVYAGMSTNYSGDGFSEMTFKVHAGSDKAFKQWVAKTQQTPNKLTYKMYDKLVAPTIGNKPEFFSAVAPDLFQQIIEKFTKPAGISKVSNS